MNTSLIIGVHVGLASGHEYFMGPGGSTLQPLNLPPPPATFVVSHQSGFTLAPFSHPPQPSTANQATG